MQVASALVIVSLDDCANMAFTSSAGRHTTSSFTSPWSLNGRAQLTIIC